MTAATHFRPLPNKVTGKVKIIGPIQIPNLINDRIDQGNTRKAGTIVVKENKGQKQNCGNDIVLINKKFMLHKALA